MRVLFALIPLLAYGWAAPAAAQGNPEDVPVKITVRAADATMVGTPVGGAYVIMRDRRNGDVLAEGVTAGHSGDAAKIMRDGFARDAVLGGDGAAKFEFSLAVLEPTPVTVTVRAPLAPEQSATTVSTDMMLLPGKDYAAGDGIVMTVPGMIVNIASPAPASRMKHDPNENIPLRAHVAKLDGTRPAPGTAWPDDRYEVEVRAYRDSAFVTAVKMQYGKEPGLYAANLKIPVKGTYRLIVTAFDPATKESGIHSTTLTLE